MPAGFGSVNNNGNLGIGAHNLTPFGPPASFFRGVIDEVSLYHRALSAAEVQAISNAGSAGMCKASKLAVTTVSPATPAPGQSFSVTVQSQSANGTVEAVSQDTTVTLSKKSGNGAGLLQGNLTGTIPAGQSSVTITGVKYTATETGVVLTATSTAGDSLAGRG